MDRLAPDLFSGFFRSDHDPPPCAQLLRAGS
jgi:hypothetical protein